MNHITKIARYLVGTLFIFSGLIKANDPIGFSYKLQEYFEEFEKLKVYFSPLESFFKLLHDLSLEQAVFMVVLEIVLGIAIISGYLPKLTAWLLLLLILFFTVLTFASAQYEIVRSCGCFGDAIPLTPWESFYKDIILITLILFIFTQKNKIEPNKVDALDIVMAVLCIGALGWLSFSLLKWAFPFVVGLVLIGGYVIWSFIAPKQNVAMYKTLIGLIISGYFTYRCYAHLPARDFRAYAIGKSIPEQMQGIPDKVQYHYLLSNKATGKQQEFTAFPQNYEAEWNYDTLRIEVLEKGVEAKITDFSISNNDGDEYTDDFFQGYQFLLIYYDLDKACNSKQTEINDFSEKAKKDGFNFNGLTASIGKTQEDFVAKNKPAYDFWVCDQVVLKTIIRSNPGLILLKDGVVLGQWHHNDFPDYEKVKEKHLKK
jgi:uncharacterized membrane protein YphA (DoxX/SURF4 family)